MADNATTSVDVSNNADLQLYILQCLERIKKRIIANINATGVRASGKTQESLHVEAEGTGGVLYGRAYFQGLEVGQQPGPRPANFTSIIRQWIIDKGLTPTPRPYLTNRPHKYTEEERSLNYMASAIAHNIRVNGALPWRGGGRVQPPTDDIYSEVINEEVRDIAEQMSVALRKSIENEYNRYTGDKK